MAPRPSIRVGGYLALLFLGISAVGCSGTRWLRDRPRRPADVVEYPRTGGFETTARGPRGAEPMLIPVPPPPPPRQRSRARSDEPMAARDGSSSTCAGPSMTSIDPGQEPSSTVSAVTARESEPLSSRLDGPMDGSQWRESGRHERPAEDIAALKAVIRDAQERYDSIPDFTAKFVKREVVRGKSMPTEEADYAFRKQPLSIYLHVTSPAGEGREVLYVEGRDHCGMHLVTGKGDHFFRGVKTVLPLDDPRVTEKSRYRITEAGFGRTLKALAEAAANGTATLKRDQRRPEFTGRLDAIEMRIAAGQDRQLPDGGVRTVYLGATPGTAEYQLPVLVQTREPDGREVEYYLFKDLNVPGGLSDSDFDPSRLGKHRE